jgi:hypothetical protein
MDYARTSSIAPVLSYDELPRTFGAQARGTQRAGALVMADAPLKGRQTLGQTTR